MPVTSSASKDDLLLESHEDRLQKMETTVQQTHVDVITQGLKLEALEEKMNTRHERVLEKMDTGFRSVTDRLQPLSQTVEALNKQTQAIQIQDQVEQQDLARRQRIRGGFVSLGMLLGGGVAAKLGEEFFKWLSR